MIDRLRPNSRKPLSLRGSKRPRSKEQPRRIRPWVWMSVLTGAVLANSVVALATPQHVLVLRLLQDFLWSFSGVFALVGLTAASVIGLLATDRIFLTARHRILLQTTHRSIALIATGFLFAHIVLQIAFTRLSPVNAFLPIGTDASITAGIISSNLLLVIIVTSIMRARFAGNTRPWAWRAIHITAYLCWPFAMVHGLTAGRLTPNWVIACYLLCLVAVCAGLVVRLLVTARPGEGVKSPDRAETVVLTPPPRPEASRFSSSAASRGADGDTDLTDDELEFWTAMRKPAAAPGSAAEFRSDRRPG